MSRGRLEAFSDGVIAILITIMVLELRTPQGNTLASLQPLLPVFLAYVLSFVNLGIYWNNHHHLLHAATVVDGRVLWANLDLLFWLSLFPFATAWMGQNLFAPLPTLAYGVVLILAAVAYYLLVQALFAAHGQGSTLRAAIGNVRKERLSLVAYAVALVLSIPAPPLALAIYVAVAVFWFVPDRRIERVLEIAGPEAEAER